MRVVRHSLLKQLLKAWDDGVLDVYGYAQAVAYVTEHSEDRDIDAYVKMSIGQLRTVLEEHDGKLNK